MWVFGQFPMSISVNKSHAVRTIKGSARITKTKDGRLFDQEVAIWMLKNTHKLQKAKDEIKLALNQGYQLKLMLYFCFSHEQLWTKDGRVKRLDTNNRVKAAVDGIAKALDIDDSVFFAEEHEKVETDEEPHIMVAIGTFKPQMKKNLWICGKDVGPNVPLLAQSKLTQ